MGKIWLVAVSEKKNREVKSRREGSRVDVVPALAGHTVKNLPAMQETQIWSQSQEDPLEKGMATHSRILAWRIPWAEEPGRLQSMVLQRVGHDWGLRTHMERKNTVDLSNRSYWSRGWQQPEEQENFREECPHYARTNQILRFSANTSKMTQK